MKRRLLANRLSYRAVMLMLLAVQLVLGFQLQAAQAVASPMPVSMRMDMSMPVHMSMANAAHASAFAANDRSADHATLTSPATSGDAAAAASTPDCPKHSVPHDCCHANACQCHCVYTPGAIAVPSLANITTSVAVWSLAATQFVAPRIDEFLRPPIA